MKIGLIIVLAVIVIGGGAYYFMQKDDADTSTTNQNSTNTATTTTARTIAEIMEQGDSMKCTYYIADPNGNQTWTMYVDGEKVRGDYEVAVTGSGSWDGHIISDGEYHYNWGQRDGQTFGTKLKLSAVNSNTNATANTNTSAQNVDYDQSYNMNCDDWNTEGSKFVPPSDVSFIDLSASLTNTSDALKQIQCAACDSGSDPAACKQALGC